MYLHEFWNYEGDPNMKNNQKLMKKTFVIFWSTFRQHLLTTTIFKIAELRKKRAYPGWNPWYLHEICCLGAVKYSHKCEKKFSSTKNDFKAVFFQQILKKWLFFLESFFETARAAPGRLTNFFSCRPPGRSQKNFLKWIIRFFKKGKKYDQLSMFCIICLVKSWNISILLLSHIMNAYQHDF